MRAIVNTGPGKLEIPLPEPRAAGRWEKRTATSDGPMRCELGPPAP